MTCVRLKLRIKKIQSCEFIFLLTRHSWDLASKDCFIDEVVRSGELGTNVSCRSVSGLLSFVLSGILC